MSYWIRLSTQVLTDAKVLAAGPEAGMLWVKGLLYSKEHLTDGLVHRSALPLLALGLADPEASAARLVDVGLWHECQDGWTVGAERWARYQSTREQVEEEREKARERQRKSRRNGSASVTNPSQPDEAGTPQDITEPSRGDLTDVTHLSRRDETVTTPVSRRDETVTPPAKKDGENPKTTVLHPKTDGADPPQSNRDSPQSQQPEHLTHESGLSRTCHAVTEPLSRSCHAEVRLPEKEKEKENTEGIREYEEGESEGEVFSEPPPGEQAQENLPRSEIPDSGSKGYGAAADGQPYRVHADAFMARWNEICRNRGWRQTHTLSESRRDMFRRRMRDPCWLTSWPKALDYFDEHVKWPKRSKKGLATLEWWIRNDSNLYRVLEGDYDDHDRSIGNGDPDF